MVKNFNHELVDGGYLGGKQGEKGQINDSILGKGKEEYGDTNDIARLKQEIN